MQNNVIIGLNAVIFANRNDTLYLLVTHRGDKTHPGLPFGPLSLSQPRTLEMGLRRLVEEQTGFTLDYVEQVYTFGDQGRDQDLVIPLQKVRDPAQPAFERVISIAYMGLARQAKNVEKTGGFWKKVESFFPYENLFKNRINSKNIPFLPELTRWAELGETQEEILLRNNRISLAFSLKKASWNEERVLERYELLYEAGILPESSTDKGQKISSSSAVLGQAMISDHRRILATSLARLRSKIKYRPILFELLPDQFTLGEAQSLTEAIVGFSLHKQNFRRSLLKTGLVEGLNTFRSPTAAGGRPAELYRFRRERLEAKPVLGIQTPRL